MDVCIGTTLDTIKYVYIMMGKSPVTLGRKPGRASLDQRD